MEDKLLHERLREMKGSCADSFWSVASKCGEETFKECLRTTANALAYEIERYYIPRPRFEDGEPVQFGDIVDFQGASIDVNDVVFHLDGSGYRLLHSTDLSTFPIGESVKRPAPKALDADGVEINVGDAVWLGTQKLVVESIGNGLVDGRYPDLPPMPSDGVSKPVTGFASIPPSDLTHREPDSLERIKADRSLEQSDYREKYKLPRYAMRDRHLLDRAIAIMERGA